ncbi:acyl carrier protein [Azospirillum sp.]|uniref:acyl carrier protein n=1 Tax=Azospirillum sp. TaxID=34012 RepID=UPI002D6C9320|nr:acyl carrier protein [Azospirillum sp.]HYD66393.1 acyl carrier protein [Azospirillum sp.]
MEAGAQRRSEIDTVIIDALTAVAPDVDPAALDPAQPFRDQIEIDSVDFLNFVLGIERRLGLRVPELDYPQFSTLDGCRAYLARAVGG